MARLPAILTFVVLLGLAACSQAEESFISSAPTVASPTPAAPSPDNDAGANQDEDGTDPADAPPLITPQAMGAVELGMSGDALADALGPQFSVTGPHTDIFVDQVLYEVSRDGVVHLYAGWLTGEPPTISLIVTGSNRYRTAEGIGPGSTIEQAAGVYGGPTLSYSLSDEGREYADFPAPSPRMLFRVGNVGELSGIYSTQDEFNETTDWRPGATIQYVILGS
ncbi:MAG: hypothetical protein WD602_10855 [Actinomycetota bacterium]